MATEAARTNDLVATTMICPSWAFPLMKGTPGLKCVRSRSVVLVLSDVSVCGKCARLSDRIFRYLILRLRRNRDANMRFVF